MMKTGTEPRLVWIQQAPGGADGLYVAECGPYRFEISRTADTGYLLQMWRLRPEDWPLVVWEMDGYGFEEAKGRAERLADQHVPAILED